MRNREILSRQFRVVLELHRHPQGLSSEKLALRLGVSRATINRDLELLRRRIGLPIERVRRTGEIWHRLRELPLSSVAATPLQVAALRLARDALAPLGGTALIGQLDALLALLPSEPTLLRGLDVAGKAQRSTAPIVRAIDLAMQEGKRLEILVRVAARGGEERRYVLDPLLLRVVNDDLYLFAWSHERKETRTFKVARIREAHVRDELADQHTDLVPEEAFRGAVKAWSGSLTQVRVRIYPAVAWLVDEYPLVVGQEVRHEPDGSAIVTAQVAGLVEPLRWVLSWGRNAEALEPVALRQAVADELASTLSIYSNQEVRSSKVSEPHEHTPSRARLPGPQSARRIEKSP
ncbi:helix-turn-helix transcriptional regulator [Sorangium sp. So ce513]|uniref:helix-turn-helix transcriptional regulator n=1 Tax=Sorangium sp. So ce513 TaxID=3133315 RepID=UPI003F60773D